MGASSSWASGTSSMDAMKGEPTEVGMGQWYPDAR
jgi:hypothetical protein